MHLVAQFNLTRFTAPYRFPNHTMTAKVFIANDMRDLGIIILLP